MLRDLSLEFLAGALGAAVVKVGKGQEEDGSEEERDAGEKGDGG